MTGKNPLRVVLIAEEAAGGRVFKLLQAMPSVSIEAVFAAPDRAGAMNSVWAHADRAELPLMPAARVKDASLADEFRDRDIDLILNVHSLYLVHPALLELPRLGAYNLHPGPLPEMAGLNVPSWAILLGHQEHGVTLHRMTAGIDEGAVAFEERFPVSPDATGLSLSLECVRRGVPLVGRLLEAAAEGRPIPAIPQDKSLRKYFDRLPPDGGTLDFGWPAARMEARVRAANYDPFPSPWGHPKVRGTRGIVELISTPVVTDDGLGQALPGTVRHDGGSRALVACADGWIEMEKVLLDGAPCEGAGAVRDGEVLTPVAGVAAKG